MMAPAWSALRAALTDRVRAFLGDGDPDGVLGWRALREAVTLARSATSWQDGMEMLHIDDGYVLAWFHWCRYVAIDRAGGDRPAEPLDDLEASLRLCTGLVTVDPGLVPDGVRAHFAETGTPRALVAEEAEGLVALTHVVEAGLAAARDQRDPEGFSLSCELLRRGLARVPYTHPAREQLQVALADAYRDRYGISGEPRDLAAAIGWQRGALGALSPAAAGFPDRVAALDDLTWRGFLDTGTDRDLRTALGVRRLREAVAEGDEERQTARLFLGEVLLRHGQRWHRPADLDEAVRHLRAVVDTAGNHPRRVLPLAA
ncbi:MAG TPA: hypothetical protein VJT31_19980, partial [Rugosimonospora sp.]|nr:hypothetical protein [Rugosimonospora sp.]